MDKKVENRIFKEAGHSISLLFVEILEQLQQGAKYEKRCGDAAGRTV